MNKRDSRTQGFFRVIHKLNTTKELERNQNIKVETFINTKDKSRGKYVVYTCNLSGDRYIHRVIKSKQVGYVFDQSFEPLMGLEAEALISNLKG